MWCSMLNVVEAAFQIDRDGTVEFVFRNIKNADRCGTPGIVEKEIDTTERIHGFGDNFACPLMARNIRNTLQCTHTKAFDFGSRIRQFRFQQIDQCDVITGTRQIKSTSLPMPRAPPVTMATLFSVFISKRAPFVLPCDGMSVTLFHNRNLVHIYEH